MHDLGHGLATLSCLVNGLSLEPGATQETRHRAGLMEKQLELLLDALDARRQTPLPEEVDVRELLLQVVSLTALSTPTWVALRPGPAVRLHIARTTLWRMVTNLVDNAVRATGSTGCVELGADNRPCNGVLIEVVDDGSGFSAGSAPSPGRGLGIVGRLARESGAAVRIQSTRQGTRSCLFFATAA